MAPRHCAPGRALLHFLTKPQPVGRTPAASIKLYARPRGLGVLDLEAMEGIWDNLRIRVRHMVLYNAQARPIGRVFGTAERDFVQELLLWCGPKLSIPPRRYLEGADPPAAG